jgi:hypothetical protein
MTDKEKEKEKEKNKNRDTPLSNTPEVSKITDLKTALADIEKRSILRTETQNAISKKLIENRRSGKNTHTPEPKLVGLKGFGSYKTSYNPEV